MERTKINVKDKDIADAFESVFANGFGNPVIFTAAPVPAEMKVHTAGFYNDELYIKFANNTVLKFTGTPVT